MDMNNMYIYMDITFGLYQKFFHWRLSFAIYKKIKLKGMSNIDMVNVKIESKQALLGCCLWKIYDSNIVLQFVNYTNYRMKIHWKLTAKVHPRYFNVSLYNSPCKCLYSTLRNRAEIVPLTPDGTLAVDGLLFLIDPSWPSAKEQPSAT